MNPRKLRIAICVQGRFHAFDLGRALISLGHDVVLLTNYPRWAVRRFGLAGMTVRTLWLHGFAERVARVMPRVLYRKLEPALHRWFGQWVRKSLGQTNVDVQHLWSGIAEEALQAGPTSSLRLLMRGSAHIAVQAALQAEEECRCGVPLERPSEWMIRREIREYAMADLIIVLSSFARESFQTAGINGDRVRLLPLGTEIEAFHPTREIIDRRIQRILSGQALRVLFVGSVSYRKGLHDLQSVIEALPKNRFHFHIVGDLGHGTRRSVRALRSSAQFSPRVPQRLLPRIYADADLFLFPTIEDGFAVVLTQAAASALPILTTTNCGGRDFIKDGETGWVLPIRSPEAFCERLRWCDENRHATARIVETLYHRFTPRDWMAVASDFATICTAELDRRT